MSNNAGQYSVSVAFSLPWKKERQPKVISDTRKKKKILKPIINTIFEKCAGLSDDDFWKAIFTDCARGKFPRNFIFKNNLLTHKKGNKLVTLELTSSPIDVYMATMNFFQARGGIMSLSDRHRMKQREEEKLIEEMENDNELSWGQVRKENLKDVLLNEFIGDICRKMNFDLEEK